MRIIIIALTLLFFSAPAFAQTKDQKSAGNSKPFVLGVIDEIQSAKLAEKRILNC
jgi:hypothetical protein